ncbi:MAG: hypothetical protein IJ935_10945 [Afipia sp.]|jgi:CBS domain containing-hemolysin-like protein|nr:hypothetical protein [Afipia sp.]
MISDTTSSSGHEVVSLQGWLNAATLGAAKWLALAAAPTFAIMALLTGILGEGAPAMLCAHDASPLSGMAAMYGLMSAFHLTPWLKLFSGR